MTFTNVCLANNGQNIVCSTSDKKLAIFGTANNTIQMITDPIQLNGQVTALATFDMMPDTIIVGLEVDDPQTKARS